MTEFSTMGTQSLRTAMKGQVVEPADPGYDEARAVWNANIDRRPAMIARCADAEDVSAAINYAREHDLEIAVRAGAHSTSGASVVDDGLLIDLSLMREVSVDPVERRAVVAGGALLADMDGATQAHGLATPAGIVGHTGVAGLSLVGGMGWLTRKAGLSLDNLVSAEVVTADGRVRRASATENPDLFWAIRGAGGNFGVVTSFEFRLHEVGPVVQLALLFWGIDQGPEVMRTVREAVSGLPPELNAIFIGLTTPPAPFVPQEHQLKPCYCLAVVGFGSPEVHEAVVQGVRTQAPPLFQMVTPIPYVQLQQMFDEANAWGFHAYDKALYVEDMSDGVIDVVTDQLVQKISPLSALFFYRLDGAYSEVADDATAFGGGRSPRYAVFIIALTDSAETLPAERDWVRRFWDALLPHAMGTGSYLNGEAEFPEDRVRSSYGPEKYARLAQIKAKYDPDNVFRRHANIPPARPPAPATAGA
jgi:FAD/FMN-containing dehydrogenase